MAKRKQARAAIPYLGRLIADEEAQSNLRIAGARLQEIYRRASKQPIKAAEDRKVYDKLREAVVSVRKVVGAMEEPPKPRRRTRAVLAIAAIGAGAGFLAMRARSGAGEAALPPNANNGSTPAGAAEPSAETVGAATGA